MTILRRQAFLAALATPALLLLRGGTAATAQTAAPAAAAPPAQAPGFYRFKLGSYTVTTVHDGYSRRPIEGLVRNAPADEVKRVLAESFLPTTHYDGVYTVPFLDTGRMLIAFDAGTGAPGELSPTSGQMRRNMQAAGLDPARVGLVVITHCHRDHIHGLTTADGQAVFPNAEVAVGETEWAWWSGPGNESRSPEGQRVNFANVARRFAPYQGRIRRFADGAEVAPGVRAVAAHGHTPGHMTFHVGDGADQLMILADTTHRPEVFARRPEMRSLFEFDAAAAEATRKRVLDRVATDRLKVVGFHFPFPAAGHVVRDGEGFRFLPVEWS
jgi:glyoxylase-like metal-dependent hydrolase (beta-lactamase superfamily II)